MNNPYWKGNSPPGQIGPAKEKIGNLPIFIFCRKSIERQRKDNTGVIRSFRQLRENVPKKFKLSLLPQIEGKS